MFQDIRSFSLVALLAFCSVVKASELPPEPHLSEVLTAKLAQSVNHRVDDVDIDGQFYRFQMESDFGNFDITSMSMLRTRVHEVTTLGHAISEFSRKNERLSDELRGQLQISADSALDIITKPVSSAANIAGQLANNLNDTLSGVPGLTKIPVYYDESASSDPTTMMHKRNVASQWQLDVYTTNPRVHKFLNTVAKTRSAGRISAGAPALSRRMDASMKIADQDLELDIAYLLKSKNVDELNFINEQILAGIGIQAELRDSFIKHPVFSPRHKTKITHYLKSLASVKNLSAFLQLALTADNEQRAVAFEDTAIMLVYYHQQLGALQKLHTERKLIQAITESNHIVSFLPVDIIYWSHSNEVLFDLISQKANTAGFKNWELVTAGEVSAEAKKALEARQFVLKDHFTN